MKQLSFLGAAMIGSALIACGSDDTAGSGSGGTDAGGAGPATSSTAAGTGGGSGGGATSQGGGGSGGTGGGTGGTGGGSCSTPAVEYDADGCLTFMGASALCGFASDDATCKLSVMCTTSTDDSQCKINCEMGATVNCYKADAVKCLVDATCAGDCDALAACKWIL